MGHTIDTDVELAESWGYGRREAVRFVARVTLARAAAGMRYPDEYLARLHQLMIATA